jgi:hypothetical protein
MVAFERDPQNKVAVPEHLPLRHPLVRSTLARWRAKPGTSWQDLPAGLDVRVSPTQRRRALRIIQALITAMEDRGMTVRITKEHKTEVVVLGESHQIRILERSRRVPHVLTLKEKQDKARGWWVPTHDMVPTGRLTLQIEQAYWSRNTWTDGERRQVEDCLNEFLEALVDAALIDARHRQQRERQRLEREEQQRQRREEEDRIKQLDEWLHLWRRTNEVRAFAAALRAATGKSRSERIAELLQWIEQYADSIDPLRPPNGEEQPSESH